MPTYNHFWNPSHPDKPHTYSSWASPNTKPPRNAMRTESLMEMRPGLWPCWNGAEWEYKESHYNETGYTLPDGWPEVIYETVGPWPENLARDPRPGYDWLWDEETRTWVLHPELTPLFN